MEIPFGFHGLYEIRTPIAKKEYFFPPSQAPSGPSFWYKEEEEEEGKIQTHDFFVSQGRWYHRDKTGKAGLGFFFLLKRPLDSVSYSLQIWKEELFNTFGVHAASLPQVNVCCYVFLISALNTGMTATVLLEARGKASAVRLHGLNKTWYCTGPFHSMEYTVISVSSGSAFSPISHSFCEASQHFDTREEDRALCLSCIFGIRDGLALPVAILVAVRAGRMIHQMNSQNMETKSLLLSLFTNRGGFGSLSLENEINVARESDVFIKVAWDDRTFSFLWRPHSREHDDVRRRSLPLSWNRVADEIRRPEILELEPERQRIVDASAQLEERRRAQEERYWQFILKGGK
ncbi:hypothetical protein SADUNF_Sadunf09G0036500 [Salix dunnii]|uniref:Uncharacterized protein n=1 Tax=Salix dunnii TaxID=1413687 RepID=A0A835JWQ6_9ROSI|nr:hypothetical protein SADUNF_Sadunf09G0036500 [Salix dunnii]